MVDKHGLYRQLSDRRAGGGELKILRDLCFRRGGPGEMRRYGGKPVYGKFVFPKPWGSMLDCLRDQGLADEVLTGNQKSALLLLRQGEAVSDEARATLQAWSLLDSTIQWLSR